MASGLHRESFMGEDPTTWTPTTRSDDAGVGVEFWYNEVRQKDYCKIVFPGDRQKVWNQPVREEDKRRFAKQWELYKAGKDQLSGQTMLRTWGKVDEGSCVIYDGSLNIKTVEQLAALPDGNLFNAPPGTQDLLLRHREMAREHVANKESSEHYDEALQAAEKSQAVAVQAIEENVELRAQMDELRKRIDSVSTEGIPFPIHVGGVGRGAKYRLSDGSEIVGKKAAIEAEGALKREPAENSAEGV